MQLTGTIATWQIALGNGSYRVKVVAGDPSNFDSNYQITAEGVSVVSGVPSSGSRFVSGVAEVTVVDGFLNIGNGAQGVNNKICFIEITPLSAAGTSARSVAYSYDAAGNRQSVVDDADGTAGTGSAVTTPYTANNLNQYTAIDGLAAPAYDTAGNTLSIQYPAVAGSPASAGWTYQYDAQNRLIGGSDGSTSFSFAYDGRSRCVVRTINGVTTANIYDAWSLIEERTAAGNLSAKHLRGANLDEILCTIRDVSGVSETRFHHHDGLGSVTALSDETGALAERVSYDIYGLPAFSDATGGSLTSSPSGNRHLFTGREWFASLRLADHRHRYYSPEAGRWLSRDPIGEAGGINLYGYVENNPASLWDSLGLIANHCPCKGINEIGCRLFCMFKGGVKACYEGPLLVFCYCNTPPKPPKSDTSKPPPPPSPPYPGPPHGPPPPPLPKPTGNN